MLAGSPAFADEKLNAGQTSLSDTSISGFVGSTIETGFPGGSDVTSISLAVADSANQGAGLISPVINNVPEPGMLALMTVTAAGLAVIWRRR